MDMGGYFELVLRGKYQSNIQRGESRLSNTAPVRLKAIENYRCRCKQPT